MTKGYFAVVDDIDADLASLKWVLHSLGYAYRRRPASDRRAGMPANILLHRVVAERIFGDIPNGLQVDHIDGDRRNNRRSNLRLVTASENSRNRKPRTHHFKNKYKGVFKDSRSGKWVAHCRFNGKNIVISSHNDEIEAARAYDAFMISNGIKTAWLNNL